MDKIIKLGMIAGILTIWGLSGSAQQQNPTIESCTANLPEGRVYQLTITGTINRHDNAVIEDGSMQLTHNDPEAPELTDEEIAPFVNCVGPLLK